MPVIRWFKSDSPFIALLLLIYALVVKGYYLAHPFADVSSVAGSGYIYHLLLDWKPTRELLSHHGQILAFVILLVDAFLLNALTGRFRLFQQTSYLTAFLFLLLSSFIDVWNYPSASLMASPLIVWALYLSFSLYSSRSPRGTVFNIGLLVGIASLFFIPSFLLLLLVWFSLMISRPFRLAEWLLAVLGILAPYYFLGTYFFISGHWNYAALFPDLKWSFHAIHFDYRVFSALGIIALLCLTGLYNLQRSYMKLLIQTRKHWSIVLFFIPVAFFIPFLEGSPGIDMFLMCLLPMSVLSALPLYYLKKSWISNLLSILFIVYILGVQFNFIRLL